MVLGITFALLSTVLWSGSFTLRKRGLEEVDYKVFIVIRLVVGLSLSSLLLWSLGSGLGNLSLRKAMPFIVTGVIGNVFALITNTLAIHEIGASRTHALISASPLVTAVLGWAFLGENITVYLLFGLLLIILGGGALSYRIHGGDSSQKTSRSVFGFTLALYSAVAIGAFAVLQKYGLSLGVTPLQGLFVRFLTASTIYGAYLILTRPRIEISSSSLSQNYLWASLVMTVAALLSLLALARLPATLVAGLKRTAPLFTVGLSYLMLRGIEQVDWKTFAVSGVIVAGAILAIIG